MLFWEKKSHLLSCHEVFYLYIINVSHFFEGRLLGTAVLAAPWQLISPQQRWVRFGQLQADPCSVDERFCLEAQLIVNTSFKSGLCAHLDNSNEV